MEKALKEGTIVLSRDNNPSGVPGVNFMGGIHPRLKRPAGKRCEKRIFCTILCLKMIFLPKQARDKHRESAQKEVRVS